MSLEFNGNDSEKWRDIPGEGETKALIPNMMCLARKTLALKPKFKLKAKQSEFKRSLSESVNGRKNKE